jgi:hypothetical protein
MYFVFCLAAQISAAQALGEEERHTTNAGSTGCMYLYGGLALALALALCMYKYKYIHIHAIGRPHRANASHWLRFHVSHLPSSSSLGRPKPKDREMNVAQRQDAVGKVHSIKCGRAATGQRR